MVAVLLNDHSAQRIAQIVVFQRFFQDLEITAALKKRLKMIHEAVQEIKGQGPLKSDAPWSANSISCASPAPASDHICSILTYVDCAAEFLVLIETCSAAAASFVRVVRHSVAAADLLNRLKIWFQRRYAFELDHPRKRLRWIYF